MKDWERILSDRRESERITREQIQAEVKRIADEKEAQREEEVRIKEEHAASLREIRVSKTKELLNSLGVQEMLSDINTAEWDGKGTVSDFEGIDGWDITRSGWSGSGFGVQSSTYSDKRTFNIYGMQLTYDFSVPEGPITTYIRMYIRYPADSDSIEARTIYLRSGEERKNVKVDHIGRDWSSDKFYGIGMEREGLQYQLALDCEIRRGEGRTAGLIQKTLFNSGERFYPKPTHYEYSDGYYSNEDA